MSSSSQNLTVQIATLKKLYLSLKNATAQLYKSFTMDKIEELIQYRQNILDQISTEEKLYNQIRMNTVVSEESKIALSELRDLINSIIGLDSTISKLLKHEMENTRNELSGLFKTSRAALAYATHRK